MTNGKSLAKTNQRTIHSLNPFFVWIMFFHSTCCNAFVFGVQASQRSPKTPSKTIQLSNNGPATTTSSFLQLPNDGPVHFEHFHIPTNATNTATRLRIHYDSHQTSLNDVTIAHVSAATATMTATMTNVFATRNPTMKAL
jgi:hypothetical protein